MAISLLDQISTSSTPKTSAFNMKDPNALGVNNKRLLQEDDYNKLVSKINELAEALNKGTIGNSSTFSGTTTNPIEPTGSKPDYLPCREVYLKAIKDHNDSIKPLSENLISLRPKAYTYTIKEYIPTTAVLNDKYKKILDSIKKANLDIIITAGYYFESGEQWKDGYSLIFPDGTSYQIPRKITEADISISGGALPIFKSGNLISDGFKYPSYAQDGYQAGNPNDILDDKFSSATGENRFVNGRFRKPSFFISSNDTSSYYEDDFGYWQRKLDPAQSFNNSFGPISSLSSTEWWQLITPVKGWKRNIVQVDQYGYSGESYNKMLEDSVNELIDLKMASFKSTAIAAISNLEQDYLHCFSDLNLTANADLYTAGFPGLNSNGTINADESKIDKTLIPVAASIPSGSYTELNSYMSTNFPGLHENKNFFLDISQMKLYLSFNGTSPIVVRQDDPSHFIHLNISQRCFHILENAATNNLLIKDFIDLSDVANGNITFKATYPEMWYHLHKSSSPSNLGDISYQSLASMAYYISTTIQEYLKGNPDIVNISNSISRTINYNFIAFYNLLNNSQFTLESISTNPLETSLVSPTFLNTIPQNVYYKNEKNYCFNNSTKVFTRYKDSEKISIVSDLDYYSGDFDYSHLYILNGSVIEKTLHENRSVLDLLKNILNYLKSNYDNYFTFNNKTGNFIDYKFNDLLRIQYSCSYDTGRIIYQNQGSNYICSIYRTSESLAGLNSVATGPALDNYTTVNPSILNTRNDSDWQAYAVGDRIISGIQLFDEPRLPLILKIEMINILDGLGQPIKFYIACGTQGFSLSYELDFFTNIHGSAKNNYDSIAEIKSLDEVNALINFYKSNIISNQIISCFKILDGFDSHGNKTIGINTATSSNYLIENIEMNLNELFHGISTSSYELLYPTMKKTEFNSFTNIKDISSGMFLNFYLKKSGSTKICYKVKIVDDQSEHLNSVYKTSNHYNYLTLISNYFK